MQMIDMGSLQGKPTEMTNTYSYSGPDSPPDDKPYRPRGFWESLATVVESVTWQLLYASNEVIGYKLLLAFQKDSHQPQPFSWMPVVATVVVGWLTRSNWNPEAPIFNQLDEQASNQQHELQIITLMDKPGDSYSMATGTWGQGQSFSMYSSSADRSHYSFANYLRGYYGDGPGWPTHSGHSYGENCYEQPCCSQQGHCIFAPSSINQHDDTCQCQGCMGALDAFISQPLINTQCDSASDGSVACSVNTFPQTGGQESNPYSGSMASVEPKKVIQEEVIVTTEPDSTSDQPTATKKRRTHSGQGGEACGIEGCTQRFTMPSQKKSHQAEVHGQGGEACGIEGCTQRFTMPSRKKSHQAEVHGQGGEACGIEGCTQRFTIPRRNPIRPRCMARAVRRAASRAARSALPSFPEEIPSGPGAWPGR